MTKADIGRIVELMMTDLNRRLVDKEVSIKLTPEAEEWIVEEAFDPVYGARPLRRYLQKTVETLAAKLILGGKVEAGDEIVIARDGDALNAYSQKVGE